jgi:hypothetical protein
MSKLKNIESFFNNLGNLHDARIEEVRWIPRQKEIHLKIDDLQSNFVNTEPQPASFVFQEVSSLSFKVDLCEQSIDIFDIKVEETNEALKFCVLLSPSGIVEFSCRFVELM